MWWSRVFEDVISLNIYLQYCPNLTLLYTYKRQSWVIYFLKIAHWKGVLPVLFTSVHSARNGMKPCKWDGCHIPVMIKRWFLIAHNWLMCTSAMLHLNGRHMWSSWQNPDLFTHLIFSAFLQCSRNGLPKFQPIVVSSVIVIALKIKKLIFIATIVMIKYRR